MSRILLFVIVATLMTRSSSTCGDDGLPVHSSVVLTTDVAVLVVVGEPDVPAAGVVVEFLSGIDLEAIESVRRDNLLSGRNDPLPDVGVRRLTDAHGQATLPCRFEGSVWSDLDGREEATISITGVFRVRFGDGTIVERSASSAIGKQSVYKPSAPVRVRISRQPNQALQTTPMTRSVYEKTIDFGCRKRGV